MSAFSTVKTEAGCPFCDNKQEWTIQFKYGNCWQYEYRIGDKIRWGGNKKGSNIGENVRAGGVAEESCELCGRNYIDAGVYFTDNIIKRVELLREPLHLPGYFEKVKG